MSRILIIDDEPAICWSLKEGLSDRGHEVQFAASVEAAERILAKFVPEAIVVDVRLPGQDGLSTIPLYRKRMPNVPIIVMTAFGELQTVVDAMNRGAFEYLVKPFELSAFLSVVERALKMPVEVVTDTAKTPVVNEIIGRSAAIQAVFKQIALVAPTEFPVLITGETGTGKELVAEAIHRHGQRRAGPFVRVSLASLSPSVIESELFGHVKGAFTGATEDRPGLFELAENGTILLDEIGDTPLPVQIKLLRVLESRRLAPVGTGAERATTARVIAATNRDLLAMIAAGTFREDLYHRLKVFSIEIPPLRQRSEDLRPLVEYFLRRQTIPVNPSVPDQFWCAIEQRKWQGNIRELRNAIDHAVVLARGGPLGVEHLPPESTSTSTARHDSDELESAIAAWVNQQLADASHEPPTDLYRRFLVDVEASLFGKVLEHTNQNRTAAAKMLGLDRATLRARLGTSSP